VSRIYQIHGHSLRTHLVVYQRKERNLNTGLFQGYHESGLVYSQHQVTLSPKHIPENQRYQKNTYI